MGARPRGRRFGAECQPMCAAPMILPAGWPGLQGWVIGPAVFHRSETYAPGASAYRRADSLSGPRGAIRSPRPTQRGAVGIRRPMTGPRMAGHSQHLTIRTAGGRLSPPICAGAGRPGVMSGTGAVVISSRRCRSIPIRGRTPAVVCRTRRDPGQHYRHPLLLLRRASDRRTS
jgi:hypothetical protein